MSNTAFILFYSALAIGLFYSLFMIAHLVDKIHQLKENLNFTRERVSFLEQLHMKEDEE